jgi:aspartyl-tRNA(Asn)/glutamyl-tRNA(Gln) amidotransferase subunit A
LKTPTDLYRRPVGDLAVGLSKGAFSARALLDHYLERVERLNPLVNAVVTLDSGATRAAEDSDARRRAGRALGPLDGVPVTVKDNLLTRGCRTTWGSPLYADYVPDHDEAPVARLKAVGAVLIGKTNTPELALRGHTDNPIFGVTRNPWNLDLTPGGSSGGAAAALALGLAPLALATDGGGSIRRPAAYTGLVGLKPGVDRIPRADGFPVLMADCEVVGAMARTVSGARLMFEALAGAAVPERVGPARILMVERFGDAPVDPLMTARCREVGAQLAALGHQVSATALPFAIDKAMAAWREATLAGLALLADREPRFFELSAHDYAAQAQEGRMLPAGVHDRIAQTFAAFRAGTARAFERIDAILTPANAASAWLIPEPYPGEIDNRPAGPRGHAIYTGWVNACGLPAIAVPARPGEDGLPVGVQLVGAPGADEQLLAMAAGFEAAHPWADRWPELAG